MCYKKIFLDHSNFLYWCCFFITFPQLLGLSNTFNNASTQTINLTAGGRTA